jgi:acetyltransferase
MMVATQSGCPAASKINPPDTSRKRDENGVALDMVSSTAVRAVYQATIQAVGKHKQQTGINSVTVQKMVRSQRGHVLNIGLTTDNPFGPVFAFGTGGTVIGLNDHWTMELLPLNQFLARRLIKRLRVTGILGKWRGASAVDHQT